MSSFLSTVHYSLPPSKPEMLYHQETGRWLVVPHPVRALPHQCPPLGMQINQAVRDPQAFESAMFQIWLVNRHLLKKLHFRSTLCRSVLQGGKCIDGRFCRYAGSLAELYANNVARNPFYKSAPCRYNLNCRFMAACPHGHEGELMRRIAFVGNRVITTGWYILSTRY